MGAERRRVLLVGCGGVSAAWLRTLTAMPEVQIVGLVDLREESARQRAEELGLKGVRIGSDLAGMLAAARPEVVCDCTVPEAHLAVGLAALGAGCHLFAEKPMADSMENARRILAAAARSGRLHAVMQNRRYEPHILRVRALLASGELGELTTLNGDFYIGAHFGGFRDQMQHPLLLDMAIHSFDQARFISGRDAEAVYCREWNPAGSWYAHGASAVAVFEMTGGVVYTYRGSWCAEGLNTSWECQWRGVMTRGGFLWDGAGEVRAERVSGPSKFTSPTEPLPVPESSLPEKERGHSGAIREFFRCLREGRTPQTAGTDNIRSLAMVFAAIESAESGRPVEVRP
jgi:predicted dehydrogenase